MTRDFVTKALKYFLIVIDFFFLCILFHPVWPVSFSWKLSNFFYNFLRFDPILYSFPSSSISCQLLFPLSFIFCWVLWCMTCDFVMTALNFFFMDFILSCILSFILYDPWLCHEVSQMFSDCNRFYPVMCILFHPVWPMSLLWRLPKTF